MTTIAPRLERSHAATLFAALGVSAFGQGMYFPLALLYYQVATSLPVSTIGITLTIATCLTLTVTPITGILVDRIGARRMVVLGQCLEAAGFVGYLAVRSVPTLLVAAILATAGARMFFASMSTLIAEVVPDAERDHWYGLTGVTQAIGGSLGGGLATILVGSLGETGFRAVIGANIACLLLAASLTAIGPGDRGSSKGPKPSSTYRTVLADRVFLALVGSNLLFVLSSMLFGVGFAVYATETLGAPLWSIGMIGIVTTGLTVVLQTRITNRTRLARRTRVIMLAGAIWIVAGLGFAFGTHVPGRWVVMYLLVICVVYTLAQLCHIPASRALAAGFGSQGIRGRYIAMHELSWGVAAAASPATFGLLYGLAPVAPWLAMTGCVALALLVVHLIESAIEPQRNWPVHTG